MKNLLALIIFLFVAHHVFAQGQHARYTIKIRTNTGVRYIGQFISVTDSSITMYGPVKSMDKVIYVGKKGMDYKTVRIHELSSITINRAGAPILITVGGTLTGLAIGGLIASGRNAILTPVLGSLAGSITGSMLSDPLSRKFKLKGSKLHNSSSVKERLKIFEAQ